MTVFALVVVLPPSIAVSLSLALLAPRDARRNDGPRRLPPPLSVDENAVKVVAGAVLLQRGLCASNLEFVEGEVRVLQDALAAAADSESSSGVREGWAIEVRQWRWARS